MKIYSFLSSINAPHDLWTIMLDWLGGVGNLGWALLILTLIVKVATSPLDYMVKWSTKKQTLVQQKCAPEVAKLQKKFGNDRQRLQMQTQALYKREGLKMGTGCLIMLVNMILTMVIFFSFYGTLRDVSAYNAIRQYEEIVVASEASFKQSIIDYNSDDEIETIEDVENWFKDDGIYYISLNFVNNPENAESPELSTHQANVDLGNEMLADANEAYKNTAISKWNEVKESWLWVQNIWVADATTTPFPTYEGLQDIAKNAGKYYKNYVENNINKDDYNKVAGIVQAKDVKNNGFYLLAILAGAVTFLSQCISDFHNRLKNKKANAVAKAANPQAQTSLKMMKIIMPIVMIMFVLSSSASFGIYLVASSVATIAIGEIIKIFVDLATRKQQKQVEEALEKEANRLIKKGKLQG